MRRIVYTCDRCHNTYEKFKSKSGMLGVQMFAKTPNPGFDEHKDTRKFLFDYGKKKYLCPSCLEEIESWYFEERDDEDLSDNGRLEKDDEAEYPEGPETPFFKPSDGEDVPFDNADEESLASI